jgi:hypothetical protein
VGGGKIEIIRCRDFSLFCLIGTPDIFHANLTPHGHLRSFDNESMSSYVIDYEYDQT